MITVLSLKELLRVERVKLKRHRKEAKGYEE
jgi:hypothetical protein